MPSTGLVPNVGEARMLKLVVNATTDGGAENPVLRLYKNDVTPASTMTLSDYTEATFTGYSAVTLSSANWTVSSTGSPVYAEYSSGVSFTCTATTSENIYGCYLSGAATSTLLWSERFDAAPYIITSSGDALAPRPRLSLRRSTLRDGLISVWELTESSGTRYDSHGTNHLTDYNGPGLDAEGGATFVSTSKQYLQASLSAYDFSAGLTFAFWVKPVPIDIEMLLLLSGAIGLWTGSPNRQASLSVSSSTGGNIQMTRNSALTYDLGSGQEYVWVCAGWNPADQKVHLRVESWTGGDVSSTGTLSDVATPTGIFIGGKVPEDIQYVNGSIRQVCLWNRFLSSAEQDRVFNGNTVRPVPYRSLYHPLPYVDW